nr:hypothetical protein [uncultured Campylobacter sp.]
MKNSNFFLVAIFLLSSSSAFAVKDKNQLEHNLVSASSSRYLDNKETANLQKRVINEEVIDQYGVKRLEERKIIYGDIETIGASVLRTVGNSSQGYGYNYRPILSSTTIHTSITNVVFEKEDTSYSLNSSKATFDFSDRKNTDGASIANDIVGKRIVYARLYWAGSFSLGWSISNDNTARDKYFDTIKNFNTIRFGTPKGYYNITAHEKDTFWFGSLSSRGMRFQYQTSADVTELVKESLGNTVASRTFSAGNIKTHDGIPPGLYSYTDGKWFNNLQSPRYGGWALVIVYDFGSKDGKKIKPKGVNIFDGIKLLTPLDLNKGASRSADITVSGFYTPVNGAVVSSLTTLSFGAASEISAEDIEIRKDSYSTYSSIFDNTLNQKGDQFNSTISKFNKHLNPSKKYNASMDLDTYDITGKLTNKQTSADIRLTAKIIKRPGGSLQGDEATVGMLAFSTDLYVPKVCYIEKLYVRDKNKTSEQDFEPVSTNAGKKTTAEKGDTLRVRLQIVNNGNEEAQKLSIGTALDPKNSTYINNTTFIKPDVGRGTAFAVGAGDKNPDNTNLQTYASGKLKFLVGQGAGGGNGGTIGSSNQAFIQFDTVLGEAFARNSYTANFENASINLTYKGAIEECTETKYQLRVGSIASKVVNKKFGALGNSENLFTQLAARKFDVKLVNLFISEENGKEVKKLDDFNFANDVYVDVIEANKPCNSAQNVIEGNKTIEVLKTDLANKSIIDLKNILIKKAYPNLIFRLSYKDAKNIDHKVCSSDSFSIRPKELRIYNRTTNTTNFGSMVGGRAYKNIWVQAIDNENNTAANYSTNIKPITLRRSTLVPATCTDGFAFLNGINLEADTTNGLGEIKISQGGGATSDFVYPNIGHVAIHAIDTKWTNVDRGTGGNPSDCITNSDTTAEDANGKIGCDTQTKGEQNLLFVPNDIAAQNLTVTNFAGGNMTYMSNVAPMGANVTFGLTARLGDVARTVATLYHAGCYSRNNSFTLGIDQILGDFRNNDGSAATLANIQNAIIFFDNNPPSFVRKANAVANNGAYNVNANAFNGGTANVNLILNFTRSVNVPKNPFTLSNQNLTIGNISDADAVAGAAYVKPTAVSTTQFYYGQVYAPDYIGPASGFNADVFYGIFCNACNVARYPLINAANALPQTNNWFVNTTHQNINLGTHGAFGHATTTTALAPNPIVIVNGVETISLSSRAIITDVISMNASSWLVFDPINAAAVTNRFNATFTRDNIGMTWGGRALKADQKNDGVGTVVGTQSIDGGANKLNDTVSNKPNKRLDW